MYIYEYIIIRNDSMRSVRHNPHATVARVTNYTLQLYDDSTKGRISSIVLNLIATNVLETCLIPYSSHGASVVS